VNPRLRVFHFLLSSVVITKSPCAGGAEDNHAIFFAGTLLLLGLYAHLQAQKKIINSFFSLTYKGH
jgi:hypothetical protein